MDSTTSPTDSSTHTKVGLIVGPIFGALCLGLIAFFAIRYTLKFYRGRKNWMDGRCRCECHMCVDTRWGKYPKEPIEHQISTKEEWASISVPSTLEAKRVACQVKGGGHCGKGLPLMA